VGVTGGHVYPALAVIEALSTDQRLAADGDTVAWVGTSAGVEQRLVAQEKLPFYAVPAGALRGVNPWVALKSLGDLLSGYRQARALVRAWMPDVVLSTGGYVSVPLVLAARSLGCPVMIYLPDIEPGFAVRFLALFAQKVAVSFPETARWFSRDKVLVSGYPVRRALYTTDKATARRTMGLSTELPALLVFGGSRGAHSINQAVERNLEALLELTELMHISGDADYGALEASRQQLPEPIRSRYHLQSYLDDAMVDALVAADLVVARAGAATLGEFPAVGLPAILVPYPYSGQHQYANARYLAQRGAAVVIDDGELCGQLVSQLRGLLGDGQRLQSMRQAARAVAVSAAASRIARALEDLAA